MTPRYPAADLGGFVRDLAAFVGFGDEDAALVRRSGPLVLRHEPALTAAVYEHFLRFPASARFFLRPDGSVDAERLERRRHSLARWLRDTAEASLEAHPLYGVLGIGLSHSHRTAEPAGAVPPELMVGATSLIQTALGRLFEAELAPAEALATSRAWNRLLMLHLAVLLLGYTMAWRESEQPGRPGPA